MSCGYRCEATVTPAYWGYRSRGALAATKTAINETRGGFEHHRGRGEWTEAVVILKQRFGMGSRSSVGSGSPLRSHLLMVTKADVVVTSTSQLECCAVVQPLARNELLFPRLNVVS
jgi:hypothetical protein